MANNSRHHVKTLDENNYLLKRLLDAGYSILTLRRFLAPAGGPPLSYQYTTPLLTRNVHTLQFWQIITIAGLLGCSIQDVWDLIRVSDHRHIRTAVKDANGLQLPPGYEKVRKASQLRTEDVPAPGWLSEIDKPVKGS